ncbi:hypothetical protein LSAT2_019873 [Lamellibrachia satsuma]|nr:hypothetical protein LSAT2_019873 [Lamellibrachia satsuma]
MVIPESKKLRKFARTSILGKPVDSVAGINGVLAKRLRRKGYRNASDLKLKAGSVKRGTFIAWMEAHVNANQLQAAWAYKCLSTHRRNHSRR